MKHLGDSAMPPKQTTASSSSDGTDSKGGHGKDNTNKSRNNRSNNNRKNNNNNNNDQSNQPSAKFKGGMKDELPVIQRDGNKDCQFRVFHEQLIIYASAKQLSLVSGSIRKLETVDKSKYTTPLPDWKQWSTEVSVTDPVDASVYMSWKVTNTPLKDQLMNEHSNQRRLEMGKFDKYVEACTNLYSIVKGQIDPRMLGVIAADPSYKRISDDEDLIEFLKLIKNTCNSDSGIGLVYGPIEWLTNAQRPAVKQRTKNSKKLTSITEYIQSTTDRYTQLKIKNGRFVYGSKFWSHCLEKDGKTFDDYLSMSKVDQKKYDDLADDLIIATLLIQNCGKAGLAKFLSNQYVTKSINCYPETPTAASSMMDGYVDIPVKNTVVDKSPDGIVSAHIINPDEEPSIATEDDISIAEPEDEEQENVLGIDIEPEQEPKIENGPSPEADLLKQSVMAMILDGTLEDQNFPDDDDDSFPNYPQGELACAIIVDVDPIPRNIDIPTYHVDEWYDCQQDDIAAPSLNSVPNDSFERDVVSGPDSRVNAPNICQQDDIAAPSLNTVPNDSFERDVVSGPDSRVNAPSSSAPSAL